MRPPNSPKPSRQRLKNKLDRSGFTVSAVGILLWTTATMWFVFETRGDRLLNVTATTRGNLLRRGFSPPSSLDESKTTHRPRIALVSSYVTRNASATIDPRYLEQHLVNKACYADLWGYDYIVNTTWGFPDDTGDKFWLEYGHWHRVPALKAAMDAGYEWVLYTDMDYVVQDLRLPLESFFKEWELAGKSDVHVFVPNDGDNLFTFSSYAILLRNSPFGRKVLERWDEAAHGLCPNGNFKHMGRYHWQMSDQPGLWYALTKTHADFAGRDWQVTCNRTTGLVASETWLKDEMNEYFSKAGVVSGSDGEDLVAVPADQSIIFSRYGKDQRSGLGVQRNWAFANWKGELFPHAFGMHTKYDLKRGMKRDLEYCVKNRGCYAQYNDDEQLEVGCSGTGNMVA